MTEDVNVCILDEGDEPNDDNCWNTQNCKNRPVLARFNQEDDVVTAGVPATFNFAALAFSLACLFL